MKYKAHLEFQILFGMLYIFELNIWEKLKWIADLQWVYGMI